MWCFVEKKQAKPNSCTAVEDDVSTNSVVRKPLLLYQHKHNVSGSIHAIE